MIDLAALEAMIPEALLDLDVNWPYDRTSGKVRESFALPGARRLFVTTDRLSAFDVVLAALPYKGQVLNELSAFWFEQTAGVIPNALLDVPDPNVSLEGLPPVAGRGDRARLHHRLDPDRTLDALRRGSARDLWLHLPGRT